VEEWVKRWRKRWSTHLRDTWCPFSPCPSKTQYIRTSLELSKFSATKKLSWLVQFGFPGLRPLIVVTALK
jgi:hypothetical protein